LRYGGQLRPDDMSIEIRQIETISDRLAALAAEHPGQLALAVARGGPYDEVSLSELEQDAKDFAAMFAHRGIGNGTRTVVMINPGRAFCAAVFGLLKLRATPVFVDPGIGLRNVGHCMRQAMPTAFVGTSKAQLARRIFGWGRGSLEISLQVGAWGRPPHPLPWESRRSEPPPSENDAAAIAFTSGSTGAPKGVVFSHENLTAQAEAVRELLGPYAREPHLTTFPLFLLFAPILGFTAVVPNMDSSKPAKADPAQLISATETYRCRSAFASPVLVRKLGAYCRDTGRKLSTMERLFSAGAPSYSASLQALASAMPSIGEIFTPYGATEALPVSNISSRELFGDTNEKTRQGAGVCVGRVLRGLKAAIIPITDTPFRDWDEVPKLAAGQIGEIAVAGGVVSRSYFNNPGATFNSKIPSSDRHTMYHRMGDVGYLDDAGRLWMCGRKSHRVVSQTKVYFTVPCEGIFNAHPDVARTALVGVEQDGDRAPVLCVELARKQTAEQKKRISNELRELGAQFDRTRTIRKILYHSSFPVDARHNSKIRREELSVWAARQIAKETHR
jgi:acyl-CoA synthetase (AMP-forming)/AMP-acid ligase II